MPTLFSLQKKRLAWRAETDGRSERLLCYFCYKSSKGAANPDHQLSFCESKTFVFFPPKFAILAAPYPSKSKTGRSMHPEANE